MRAMIIGGSLAALTVMAGPVVADAGRYVMEPTEDGFVRMDTETGEMSVCALEGDEVVCRLGADERAAFFDALDALEARVAVLERRLNSGAGSAIERDGLPDPEEFERGLGYMEEFMRRFMGIVEEFEGAPDRT
ncbi:MAG: hypothetical protein JJ926_15045 [Roseitalea sp.]|nr:hypothetical protein [Roseitalea sp.]MBO6953132.1 hypothetical protein [Rhizobiaceae bacterium]MBO6593479.1 hypothetical protein [Roseitalea sp.]MBO6600531.1 hypothetical protein [Roseitalea sp.]MBO6612212.1 hypothetical protein [Roseitalea sp.]